MLNQIDDIWILRPTEEDLNAGATYAAISMPWTYNRMSLSLESKAQQSRALNIAKGIVVQETLRRALDNHGISAVIQRKSHRDTDLFDLQVVFNGTPQLLDIKSFNFYSNYRVAGREQLNQKLIFDNRSYAGPEWHRFFPLLVPFDQINKGKNLYCFVIASSIDPRRDQYEKRSRPYALAAFPYGEWVGFVGSSALCLQREAAGRGIYLSYLYSSSKNTPARFTVVGEWDRQRQLEEVIVETGQTVRGKLPFSCVASFRMRERDYRLLNGEIKVSLAENEFLENVSESRIPNVNIPPANPLILNKTSFCNLSLPNDLEMYVMGWVTRSEFGQRCRQYTGWISPSDANPKENRPWTMVSPEERKVVEQTGFADAIKSPCEPLAAGWMKRRSPTEAGACCYVFPYTGNRFSGVQVTNVYVLPCDLERMDDFG